MIPGFAPIDLTLLDLAQRAYGACSFNSEWSHLLLEETDDYIAWAFRGTEIERVADDLVDADALATDVPGFGMVHEGFQRSACTVLYHAIPRLIAAKATGKKHYGTGHSKGGGEARQATGCLKLIGLMPDRVSVWEPARSCSAAAWAFIADVPGIGTHNGSDRVTKMPGNFIAEPLVQLGRDTGTLDPLEWLPDHRLANVAAALAFALKNS